MTAVVVIVNVAVVVPAATVTLPGTVEDELLSESATATPPAGAAELSVTRPVALLPPTTLEGVIVTEDSATVAGAPPSGVYTPQIGR